MTVLISDSFTDSLAKLTGSEQKVTKTTAFDLQLDPSNPGMQFHKLNRAKDPNFCSVRVSKDVRIIVHKSSSTMVLCYVDHHDRAYKWAEKRRLERHPKTGAAQFVEIRERVEEVVIRKPVVGDAQGPAPLFENVSNEQLLSYGVPPEWLEDVRKIASEDNLLDLVEHLPHEAAEALLELATGSVPKVPKPVGEGGDPFEHPDAKRRFRVVASAEELQRALEYPWEKWAIFLHPAQQSTVERQYNGPARVSGSAGTGKTVVALHRAVHLARQHRDARVLLTTFSDMLANALKIKLRRLVSSEPRLAERIDVESLNSVGRRLYEVAFEKPKLATAEQIDELLAESADEADEHQFSMHFLREEWGQVVDAWQLDSWEAYRDVMRLGRKTRLPESKRTVLWRRFEKVRQALEDRGLISYPTLFSKLAQHYEEGKRPPYDFVVVDESQDVSVPQLRFLASLGNHDSQALFFAGDLGQRIFQQPFSWKALGVDIRGRSSTLKVNYRTSHQIRMQADRLLDPRLSDVDGNLEDRRGTTSAFTGPKPTVSVFGSANGEVEAVGDLLQSLQKDGYKAHEIGVFVRSEKELGRARSAVEKAGLQLAVLDDKVSPMSDHVAVSTMHLAKGLEFRAVIVMACDDEVIPLQARIETVTDDSDLEEVYNTERQLLYVACTRARDVLHVSGVDPASEFLDDLGM